MSYYVSSPPMSITYARVQWAPHVQRADASFFSRRVDAKSTGHTAVIELVD